MYTDADEVDHIELLANAHAKAESLWNSQQRPAGGIDVHVNAEKSEHMFLIKIKKEISLH